jgi:hypothetical protein
MSDELSESPHTICRRKIVQVVRHLASGFQRILGNIHKYVSRFRREGAVGLVELRSQSLRFILRSRRDHTKEQDQT